MSGVFILAIENEIHSAARLSDSDDAEVNNIQTTSAGCPQSEAILPCSCWAENIATETKLYLDCTGAATLGQLETVFQQDFPVKSFYQFSMNHSYTFENLNITTNGVNFIRFQFSPGPFVMKSIADNFLKSSLLTMRDIVVEDSKLETFPFENIHNYKNLELLFIFNSSISSIPKLESNSIRKLSVGYSNLTEIIPGKDKYIR